MGVLDTETGECPIQVIRTAGFKDEICGLKKLAKELIKENKEKDQEIALHEFYQATMPVRYNIRKQPEQHQYPVVCVNEDTRKSRIIRTKKAYDSIGCTGSENGIDYEFDSWMPCYDLFRLDQEPYVPF